METATVNGSTLAYDSAGAGSPVLFIHGAMIADAFAPLLEVDSLTREYQLIAFHRRGYGESGVISRSFSIADQARDCIELLRSLGVERAHIVGHSYGGVIGTQLALDAPDMVHTLALLEPAVMVGASGDEYRNSLLAGVQQYKEHGAENVVDRFLAIRFGDGYRESLEQNVPGAFAQSVADAATPFEVELPALIDWSIDEAKARTISQPVLCVLGHLSRELSPRFVETYETLQAWFRDSERFELDNAAHGLQMQNPQGMAQGLAQFWQKRPI